MVCTPHQKSIGLSNQENLIGRFLHKVWKRGEVGKPERKRSSDRPKHRWEWVILKWIFKKWDGVKWTGLIMLGIVAGREVV